MFSKRLCQVIIAIFLQLSVSSVKAQDWQATFDKADSLRIAGNYADAFGFSEKALKLAETTFGKQHQHYARTLWQFGVIQFYKNDYSGGEAMLKSSADLYKTLGDTLNADYIETLLTIGDFQRALGKLNDGENAFKRAIRLKESISKEKDVLYINLLGGLGNLYIVKSEYDKAEPLLLEALAWRAKNIDKQSVIYVSNLNSLGALYGRKEDYIKSEPYLLEALQIRQKALGPEHPLVGPILINIGYNYLQQGAYTSAIPFFIRANKVYEKQAIGNQSHLIGLNNLAVCYDHTKQYRRADSLYRVILPIMAEKLGANNSDYGTTLSNLGEVVEAQGDVSQAEALYLKALSIHSAKDTQAENTKVADLLKLAETYHSQNKLAKSDSLFRMSLAITRKVVGMNGFEYANILPKYARLLIDQNQADSAFAAVSLAQVTISRSLLRNFLYQTIRQKESLVNKWDNHIQTPFNMAYKFPKRNDLAKLAYESNLFRKNLLLSQQTSFWTDQTRMEGDRFRLITDTLRRVSNQVSAQYALPLSQRKHLDSLENRAEILEKELASQSAPFRQAQKELRVRWQDVRDALKPTEAAVEFISFAYYKKWNQADTIRYIALVLRPGDSAPQVVPLLADEAPLRRLLARKLGSGNNALYATRGSELDTDQLTRGDSLYQLVWQPIDTLLKGVKTVYISPSGLLHQVAFAALPYADGKKTGYLADRYQLRQVGSTRQIVTASSSEEAVYQAIGSAKLYGGIQYGLSGSKAANEWPFLPGTLREVDQISRLIGPKATTVTDTNASEASVKALSGNSPSVVHIATHGFVFPDPITTKTDSSLGGNTFRQISNPLFRTGLLMAGSNRVWQGAKPALGQEDGILTAYEVANLNLSKTKLVVLSACETALGDIRGSEGVFGLQRAFKMAGVDYLLMSLWPVADDATSALMTQFYTNWKRYKTIRMAFQKTQLQMRKTYPPSVWAAFVLVE